MRAFFYKLFHEPSFQHTYSSAKIYFCNNVHKPKIIGTTLFLPVRWWRVDMRDVFHAYPQSLQAIRSILSKK